MVDRIFWVRPTTLILVLLAAMLSGDVLASSSVAFAVRAHQHAPMIFRGRRGASLSSSNWSGYVVTGADHSVTSAKGSWIVPIVQGACTSTDQFAATWVGIDGVTSNTVEQLGTDADCQGGMPVYFAWYEIFPRRAMIIESVPVSPGDHISAEVSFTGHRFTLSMNNLTTGAVFTKNVWLLRAKRSSAQWITEAPSSGLGLLLPLANFGTVSYGADFTGAPDTCEATVDGVTGAVGSFAAAQSITMESESEAKATPSALSDDGSSFSITWDSSGP